MARPVVLDRRKPNLPASASELVRQQVAAMTRLIVDGERELRALRNKRKKLILAAWMRDRRSNPVFQEKMSKSMKAAWADPAKAKNMFSKGRPRVLPDMTAEQRRVYKRYRVRYGLGREVALREAFREVGA